MRSDRLHPNQVADKFYDGISLYPFVWTVNVAQAGILSKWQFLVLNLDLEHPVKSRPCPTIWKDYQQTTSEKVLSISFHNGDLSLTGSLVIGRPG